SMTTVAANFEYAFFTKRKHFATNSICNLLFLTLRQRLHGPRSSVLCEKGNLCCSSSVGQTFLAKLFNLVLHVLEARLAFQLSIPFLAIANEGADDFRKNLGNFYHWHDIDGEYRGLFRTF
uniref:Uncharacterized protein n=1 Tax=Parascaris univalens TaxID=6257 RepID=A0A915BJN2_PARUN